MGGLSDFVKKAGKIVGGGAAGQFLGGFPGQAVGAAAGAGIDPSSFFDRLSGNTEPNALQQLQMQYLPQAFQQAANVYGIGAPSIFSGQQPGQQVGQQQLPGGFQNQAFPAAPGSFTPARAGGGFGSKGGFIKGGIAGAVKRGGSPFSQGQTLPAQGFAPPQGGGVAQPQGGGFNQNQIDAQNAALDFAGGGGLGNLLGGANSALLQNFNAADVSNNPALQSAINTATRPLLQQFGEQTLPGIGDDALLNGQFGSSRHGIAEGIARRGLQDTFGDISSNLTSNAYNQGLQAQQRALALAPSIAGLGLLPSQIQQGVGQQQFNLPRQNLQDFVSLVGGIPNPQQPDSSNPLFSLLGAGAGAALGGVPGATLGASVGGLFG